MKRTVAWLRATLRVDQAVPPTNVCVITGDGTTIPVDLVYTGRRRRDGTHVWEATAPAWIGAVDSGWRIHADVIPAHTTIVLTMAGSST